MNPRYQRWLDSLLYVGAMAVIIACILMAYIALTGCTAVNAGKVFNWLAPSDKEPDVILIVPEEREKDSNDEVA